MEAQASTFELDLGNPNVRRRAVLTGYWYGVKVEHGIGIHTVEKIVKSYGGTLKIDIDNKVFIASIIFQVDKSGL